VLNLADKVVLVTGTSSGLGVGIARVFVEAGARVIGTARRAAAGDRLAAELKAIGDFTFVAGDVAEEAHWPRLAEAALGHGRIDVLINNAAVTGEPDIAPIEQLALETWDKVQAVNLRGAFLGCRAVLPQMKAQRSGVILNVASFNARFGLAGLAPYNASKAGLVQLTNTVAVEGHDFGVRANSILLGGVRTEGGYATGVAMGRMARGEPAPTEPGVRTPDQDVSGGGSEPIDVGKALAALCVDEARLITGAEIAIDQAMLAGRAANLLITGGAAAHYT
jgi:3alpha(or 20beta)-hydroxysteroid dehydrogenase